MVGLGPSKRQARQLQGAWLNKLFFGLVGCVFKLEVTELLLVFNARVRRLLNSDGRIEKITKQFITKWGNQYVSYWQALSELRRLPVGGTVEPYLKKQKQIREESERLISDLQIIITNEMRETVEEMLHHESLHVDSDSEDNAFSSHDDDEPE